MKAGWRVELGRKVANAAVAAVASGGKLVAVEGLSGKPAEASVGPLKILMTTPFTGAHGTPARYGVDVWSADVNGLKVFSAWWNGSPDDDSFEVVAFTRGKWVFYLVPDAPLEI